MYVCTDNLPELIEYISRIYILYVCIGIYMPMYIT